jgi:hydroxymethylbilane synthase
MERLRIATRQSRLALWQAEDVARQVQAAHPQVSCELVRITTAGDRFLDAPLGEIGGKGLFIKELEVAMLEGRADIAVHSMKDVTVEMPAGFMIPVIMARANPFDALVSPHGHTLETLPAGARVGSSSLRRQCQIRAMRPELSVSSIRGNVDTRLSKLDGGEFDALVLACAGLERLALEARISQQISPAVMVPAIGQGAMGIECREGDSEILALITSLNDPDTSVAVRAERAVNQRLGGGCHAPVAGYATLDGEVLHLHALVGSVDGQEVIEHRGVGTVSAPEALGEEVAAALIERGAERILESISNG